MGRYNFIGVRREYNRCVFEIQRDHDKTAMFYMQSFLKHSVAGFVLFATAATIY